MTVYVSLGPSLALDAAREVLPDARFVPPVAMGDVYNLVVGGARVIGIIDGLFEQIPAVWHKEILFALESGVHVYGASSMGALRAAELHPFGMIGVGGVFEAYRDGAIEDDDEVAVAHATADSGYRQLSDAMVNIRAGVREALADGAIGADTAAHVVRAAKALHYAERTWHQAIADARPDADGDELDALRGFVRERRPNAKRDDAIALLERIRRDVAGGLPRLETDLRVERTSFWLRLVDTVARPAGGDASGSRDVARSDLLDHIRISRPDLDALREACLLTRLVRAQASQLGLTVTPGELQRASESLRRDRGMRLARDTTAWMANNGMSTRDLRELLVHKVLLAKLSAHYGDELDNALPQVLWDRDELEEQLAAARRKAAFASARGLQNPTMEDTGATAEQVFRWYEERTGRTVADFEQHARSLGFRSGRAFLAEVLTLFMCERERADSSSNAPIPANERAETRDER